MPDKLDFYSELLLDLCKKHGEFYNARTDLYVAAHANNTQDSDEYQYEFHTITNNVVFTFNAFKMVSHILFSIPTYCISFEELRELYDNNTTLTHQQAADLFFEGIQKLIDDKDLEFTYLLLDDNSLQVNLDLEKIQG